MFLNGSYGSVIRKCLDSEFLSMLAGGVRGGWSADLYRAESESANRSPVWRLLAEGVRGASADLYLAESESP